MYFYIRVYGKLAIVTQSDSVQLVPWAAGSRAITLHDSME